MLSRTRLAACLVLFALLSVACSSNTLVSRDDRASESDAENETVDNADDGDNGGAAETFGDSSTETSDEESTGDSRGDRDNDDESDDASDDTPQTPRELEEAGGFGLGGAEQLAGLATDCQEDNDLACDVLFAISGFDSPEEDLALTCGGRSEAEVLFCTPGITAEDDLLSFDITSDGLDRVVTLCEIDGDMTACDFLYFRSPEDSTFEEVGGSCGGRVNVAVPDCRTFLSE